MTDSTLAVIIVVTVSLDLLLGFALLRLAKEIRLYLAARRVSEIRTTRPIRPFDDDDN